ncbi:M48 family metallopeptidase [Sporobolomyces salmoneus]|uniref:M48 family metallopeptidase n=1 Tax=Sporobolomyces salmoneus TaxID=183962 RepID=UPI00316E271D
MAPTPRISASLLRPLNFPSRSTSSRSFTSSPSPILSRYQRFGDPPPSERPVPPSSASHASRPNDPWAIIRKLPTPSGGSRSSGGSRGSPFSDIRYRATTVLRQPLVLVLIGGGGAYYVFHLERVPETGRWRFMDVTPETEKEVAKQSFEEVMGQFGGKVLRENHPTTKYVREVVGRIIESNDLKTDEEGGKGWEVFVVKDDSTQNAFVIPGGKIFVFSGILPIAKDQDGLAVILGHEIAHQVARHSAERLSSMKVLVALSYLLTTLGIDLGLSRILLNVGMTLPNSRKNESEADLIGLRLANNACFDPRSAEDLWKRMDQVAGGAGGGSLDFLSTHPSSSNRSVKVREWAEEILKERPAKCGPVRENVGAFQSMTGMSWR